MPNTLIGIFLDSVSTYRKPDQFMRKSASGWESISGERALADVEGLALGLRELGVQRGDRVAILSENRYEWPVADLAILGLGAVTVPIYPTVTAAQCRHIVGNSEASIAIVSSASQLAKMREAAMGLATLRTTIVIDAAVSLQSNERAFADLTRRGRERRTQEPNAFRASAESVTPDDLATIIYTSGTTGEPKGAMLTHGNIASNVIACLDIITVNQDDLGLSFLPLCHIFERMAGLYCLLKAGATIAYAENFETVASDALETRPTVLNGVPRFYEKVYARVMDNVRRESPLRQRIFHWGLRVGLEKARAHFEGREVNTFTTWLADRLVGAKVRARVGGRLRFCVSGGAPLATPVMEFFFAVGIPIIEGYGLTETSPVICLNRLGQEKPGSVGPPVPGVEVRIGEEGEIQTRGPHVMRGYYKNDEATRLALRGGWFHTGDVGMFDPSGRLVITDRLKDLLVTAGGKKIAPQPIEANLKTSKLVSEAVLLGDKRPFVVCLVVPNVVNLEAEAKARGWSAASPAELIRKPEALALYQAEIDRVNENLAHFEQIKRFGLLDHELTQDAGHLTPTLKVKRRVIMEKYGSIIDSLYVGHEKTAAA